jgi:hypothetical protein
LLIKGYLGDWLTFRYPLQTSRLREDLILREMRDGIIADIYFLKTLKESAIAGGLAAVNKKAIDLPDKPYEGYIRSRLPSLLVNTKLDAELTPERAAHWKKILEEKNKKYADNKKSKKPKKP